MDFFLLIFEEFLREIFLCKHDEIAACCGYFDEYFNYPIFQNLFEFSKNVFSYRMIEF
jgi:hypothetical protein